MNAPEVIKKGLEHCKGANPCADCAYDRRDFPKCIIRLQSDALSLIQQLESDLEVVKRERDAAVADLSVGVIKCDVCKHGRFFGNDCIGLFGDGGCSFEWRGVCPENTEVQEDAAE